jgi:hypothetical protein
MKDKKDICLFAKKSNVKKYTKKHLKKYPFCTKMKINIEKGTCVLF